MVLSDGALYRILPQLFPDHADPALVNPASIDIRIGRKGRIEAGMNIWRDVDLTAALGLFPKQFMLVETLERICVPNGYVVELKLKSSRAREGFNHSLAFWFDPGWDGIGTMEIQNVTDYQVLPVYYGLRFGQIIVHELDALAINPYNGRYQGATGVEGAKEVKS